MPLSVMPSIKGPSSERRLRMCFHCAATTRTWSHRLCGSDDVIVNIRARDAMTAFTSPVRVRILRSRVTIGKPACVTVGIHSSSGLPLVAMGLGSWLSLAEARLPLSPGHVTGSLAAARTFAMPIVSSSKYHSALRTRHAHRHAAYSKAMAALTFGTVRPNSSASSSGVSPNASARSARTAVRTPATVAAADETRGSMTTAEDRPCG